MAEHWQKIVSGLKNTEEKVGASAHVQGFQATATGRLPSAEEIIEALKDRRHEGYGHASIDVFGPGGYWGATGYDEGGELQVTAVAYRPEGCRTGFEIAHIALGPALNGGLVGDLSPEDLQAFRWGMEHPDAIVNFDSGEIIFPDGSITRF